MSFFIKHDVLVHLIAQQQNVRIRKEHFQTPHIPITHHPSTGVMGRIDDDHARTRADRRFHGTGIEIHLISERHMHRQTTEQAHRWRIAVIRWIDDDHLITGMDQGSDGGEDGLGGTCRNGDLRSGIVVHIVKFQRLLGDRFVQRWKARHGGILVVPIAHRLLHQPDQYGIHRQIGITLGQVDRSAFTREAAHHTEDGGAHPGKFVQVH